MPWTFATMGIATLAIAGIPPLAGFWSKDEILWRAYNAHPLYWLIGVITAFITSFYMFRLMYMTFAGDYRGAPVAGTHGHDDHGHGHGHGWPHESPWVMLGPLVVLAILSVVGGFVGIGGGFEHFLAPVFQTAPGVELTGEASGEAANKGLEYLLMGVSATVAFAGWFFAYLLYSRRPELPERIATSLGRLYHAVANKYYVDELYASIFVKPLLEGSTAILWKGVDQGVIDATVNNAADSARHTSDNARHMQSGNLRSYAGWVAAGGAVVIAYMVWMGVR
jgi:NADH-quinone oxidoreductase subunit L